MGARLRKRRARIPTADRGRQTSNKRYGNHCRGDRSVLGLCTEDIETEEIKSIIAMVIAKIILRKRGLFVNFI